MIKKIFRAANFLVLSILVVATTFFSSANPTTAAQMDPDMNEDNPMSIVIQESSDSFDGSKTTASPDLGDEQAFPFIPGFGKNSGKD